MNNKKPKIGYLDVVIVIAIIAVLIAGGMYLTKNITATNSVIEFTIDAKYIDEEVAQSIKLGESVFESNKNEYIGEITQVNILPMKETVENKQNGSFEIVEVPEKYNVLITIKGNGVYNEESAHVESYELYLGKTFFVKNKDFALGGVVISVKPGVEK